MKAKQTPENSVSSDFANQKIAEVKTGNVTRQKLDQIAQEAIVWARNVSQTKGEHSTESAAAWDTVEELLAAIADRRNAQKKRTALDVYCDEHPEAQECLVYDL